ncbi:MAG: fibronectin type III domain-containing protein, partial [Nitrospira sp.]
MLRRYLCVLVVLLVPSLASATTLFSWDADQLSTTSLGPILTVQGGTTIDTATKHSGTGSMRMVVSGDQQFQGGIEPGGPIRLTPGQRYFHRWWMKFDSNFHWRTGGGFSTFKMNRVSDYFGALNGCCFTQHLEPYRISISECDGCNPKAAGGDGYPDAPYNFDPQTNTALQAWHEYIIEFKLNSARDVKDGEYAFYVDGVQIARRVNQSYCCVGLGGDFTYDPSERWGMTMVRPFWQILGLATDGGVIWVDDFSNDTVWNSNYAQPPSGTDTINPTQVIGVTATATNSTSVQLTGFSASDSQSGVAAYLVYRCAGGACSPTVNVATTAGPPWSDSNLTAGTTYGYALRARDGAGNVGAASTTVYVATPAATSTRNILATDAFARADGADLGASWDAGYTAMNALKIVSQGLQSTTVNTQSLETYNGVVTPNDQWAKVTILDNTPTASGGGTPTYVQATTAPICGQSGLTATASLTGVSAGNLLIHAVRFSSDNRSISSMAGNSNTYTSVLQSTGSSMRLDSRYAANATAGNTTVTTTFDSAAASTVCPALVEYSGIATASPLDGSNMGSTLSASSVSSGSITTTSDGDLLVLVAFSENTSRPLDTPTGFTARVNVTTAGYNLMIADKTQATAGAVSATCAVTGGNSAISCQLMAFKAGGGSTPVVAQRVWLRTANAATVTGYACVAYSAASSTRSAIEEWTAGTPATLTSTTGTAWAEGDALQCTVEGTTITLHRIPSGGSETSVLSTTDASIASGKTGLSILVATGGALADGHLGTFTMGSIGTPADPPTLNSLVPSSTGLTVTYGVTPTAVRFQTGARSVIVQVADLPGGVWTTTWTASDAVEGYVCGIPIDALGVENTASSATKCASLAGLTDITAPTLSNPLPSGTLAFGTTTATMAITSDESASCRYSLSDSAYGAMSLTFATSTGLAHSADLTGLTAGTYTYYANCADATGNIPATNTSITFTIEAAPAVDNTAPTAPTNLVVAIISPTQATLSCTASTDAVGVTGYDWYACKAVDCPTMTLIAQTASTTAALTGLTPSTPYTFEVRARDAANNISDASASASATTAADTDVIPPSTPTGLTITRSNGYDVALSWTAGTDNLGVAGTIIESCTGSACTNFRGVGLAGVSATTYADRLAPPSTV